jgi:hypothetical protein
VDWSQKQLQRVVVIENAVDGRLSVSEAANTLGRSQVKRLKQRFDPEDASWRAANTWGSTTAICATSSSAKRV